MPATPQLLSPRTTRPRTNDAAPGFSRLLHPASNAEPPLSPVVLLALAEDLARTVDAADLHLTRRGQRDFRRLIRSELFEAWLISWGPSTFLELHDHGGSNGAFRVVSGVLAESRSDTTTRMPLQTRRVAAGAQRGFGAYDVHEVWNPDGRTAVSLHVYSPPLSRMNFFSDRAEDYLTRQRTDIVDGGCPEAAHTDVPSIRSND